MMLTIIFPVLNERLRLESGITRTVEYLQSIQFEDYEIVIVDNGSEDETPEIAAALCEKYATVKYERISIRGVGAAFRRGVELSKGEIVGYMDIDLSTNIKHLGEAIEIFKNQPEVAYINGSRFANESDTKGRKWYRKITSQGLLILLKLFLRMKSTDAICGFTFVRRETALSLVEGGSQGVAAGKQHLLHLRVGCQICGHLINFLGCRPPKAGATGRLAASSLQGLRDEALPKAVAAVGKAAAGGKHQHPVLVLVHHALCSLMEAGSQGICKLLGQHQIFFWLGKKLAA